MVDKLSEAIDSYRVDSVKTGSVKNQEWAEWDLDMVQLLHYCTVMPEIIRFARSVVRMYADDHRPPHFHIAGPDFAVMVDIRGLEIIGGEARTSDIAAALAWAKKNQTALAKLWQELNEREQP